MISLNLNENKLLKISKEENIFVGDSNISLIQINLPDRIGGYSTAECTLELYAVLENGTHIVYPVESDYIRVSGDLTERAQTVLLFIKITKDGNIVGRSNVVGMKILDFTAEGIEIAPRDELDAIIARLERENAQLFENIEGLESDVSEKNRIISSLTSQISGLNSQVSSLTQSNTELSASIVEKDRTINNLSEIYNTSRYQVKTVVPQALSTLVTPDEGYFGLSAVMVAGTAGESARGLFFLDPDAQGNPTKAVFLNFPLNSFNSMPQVFYDNNHGNIYPTVKEILFVDCDEITSLPIRYFWTCRSVTKIVLPQNLTSLPENLFYYCDSLTDIEIPDSVTSLGWQAFLGCDSLDEIKIPNSVTQIAYGVFQRCSSLLKVDMTELDHVPVLGGEIIDRDTNPNLKFIVADQNMKTAFQNANIWSNYSSKIVTQAEFNSI